jgi:PPK2 family polyphosphate:nucleotide phosphotransferase
MGSKAKQKLPKSGQESKPLSQLLQVPAGPVSLAGFDPSATPGYVGKGKADAAGRTADLGAELSRLQEMLFANGRNDPVSAPKVLLVLQGMDTSGKGGVVRHVMGLVDPQGVALASFKAPSAIERKHHYLWRIRQALPQAGSIGVFDRSHYEDVLVVRVENLVDEAVWEKRYEEINRFEQRLVASGTKVVKCMLQVSFAEQKARLAARLDDPTKYWKYNPSDVDARAKWPAYQEAYEALLERCNTEAAPWHVVPSDRKWYRNWAIAELLRESLAGLDLSWPKPGYDLAVERDRVAKS